MVSHRGYVPGQNWEQIREVMRPFDIPIVVVFLALMAIFVWRRLGKLQQGGHP